jgi:hypothetical protein
MVWVNHRHSSYNATAALEMPSINYTLICNVLPAYNTALIAENVKVFTSKLQSKLGNRIILFLILKIHIHMDGTVEAFTI